MKVGTMNKLVYYIMFASSSFLLCWYFPLRWLILNKSNQEAVEWLSDPMGSMVAIISFFYMLYTLYKLWDNKSIQNELTVSFITPMLCFINFAFMLEMINIYNKQNSFENFLYLSLDVFIFYYYTLMVKLCYMTKNNTNMCKCHEVKPA